MILVEIDYWSLTKLYQENETLYDELLSLGTESFKNYPRNKKVLDDKGNKKLEGYCSATFYINDFSSFNETIWPYCVFKPLKTLKMMNHGSINSSNVLEAAKRNQIMLPNLILYEMKELLLKEDACTYDINDHLKDDWKIIAVLPQHGQRRPDYILGK
jgi:hypothetical protein